MGATSDELMPAIIALHKDIIRLNQDVVAVRRDLAEIALEIGKFRIYATASSEGLGLSRALDVKVAYEPTS